MSPSQFEDYSLSDETNSPNTKAPLEFDHCDVKFVIFGHKDSKKTIYAKSRDTPVELMGSYPIDRIEVSSQRRVDFLIDLVCFWSRPVHWIMSYQFSTDSDQLVMLWHGLATRADKIAIKKVLDRNALDIADAASESDSWSALISVSPVIAECMRATDKYYKVRIILWLSALISTIGLAIAFC